MDPSKPQLSDCSDYPNNNLIGFNENFAVYLVESCKLSSENIAVLFIQTFGVSELPLVLQCLDK